MVLPLDVYRCRGCDHLLRFDERTRVPDHQVGSCKGRCDWLLLERQGRQVAVDPGPARTATVPGS